MTDTELYLRWIKLRQNIRAYRLRRKYLPDGTTDRGAYKNGLRDEVIWIEREWRELERRRYRGEVTDMTAPEMAMDIAKQKSDQFFMPVKVEFSAPPHEMDKDVRLQGCEVKIIYLGPAAELSEEQWEKFALKIVREIVINPVILRHWRAGGGWSIPQTGQIELAFQLYRWDGPQKLRF